MRVLFYLEPHPIRNRRESFGFIGDKVFKMVREELVGRSARGYEPDELRILISRHYVKIQNNYKSLAPAVLGLTKDENDKIDSFLTDWSQPGAIELWRDLLNGEGDVSDFYCDVLSRIHSTVYDFDTIVTWSTNGAVSKFCRQRGLNHVLMEQGCVRNPVYESVYVDAVGVNGAAMTRHLNLDLVCPKYSLTEIRTILPTKTGKGQHTDAAHKPILSSYSSQIYANLGSNVLIALQLKDDSNCQIYSKYSSMHELLNEILPPLVAAGKTCYIKPHPAAKDRKINLDDHQLCEIYAGLFDNVHWLSDIKQNDDYISLLCKMDWVITVNSSTAFEAMIYEVPVVILGEAPFNVGKLPKIQDVVTDGFDRLAYLDTITKIVNAMLFSYLTPAVFAFEYKNFMQNLVTAIRLKNTLKSYGKDQFTLSMRELPDRLDYKISDQILAEKTLLNRFSNSSGSAVEATSTVSPSRPSPSAIDIDVGALKKKLTKFRRDPAKFFVDSQNPLLAKLGGFIGGRK